MNLHIIQETATLMYEVATGCKPAAGWLSPLKLSLYVKSLAPMCIHCQMMDPMTSPVQYSNSDLQLNTAQPAASTVPLEINDASILSWATAEHGIPMMGVTCTLKHLLLIQAHSML